MLVSWLDVPHSMESIISYYYRHLFFNVIKYRLFTLIYKYCIIKNKDKMSTLNVKVYIKYYTTRINTPNIKNAHSILNMHTDSNKEANLKPIYLKLIIIINYINEASREEELRAHPIKVNKR